MAVAGGKFEPREFHPYEQAEQVAVTPKDTGMTTLRRFFAAGGFK